MKVIGKQNNKTYLAIVTHEELEKCMDRTYSNGGMEVLEVGAELSLGAGHSFRNEIIAACKGMVSQYERFSKAQSTLLEFCKLVGKTGGDAS